MDWLARDLDVIRIPLRNFEIQANSMSSISMFFLIAFTWKNSRVDAEIIIYVGSRFQLLSTNSKRVTSYRPKTAIKFIVWIFRFFAAQQRPSIGMVKGSFETKDAANILILPKNIQL